ncbi:hypothetical protein T03_9428 [Trichinella britovi]|uniref:Uncharacterized protein n=1 Tax=Trichinella britovi TaxID=45882 RepID=A0A0V1CI97_TRIBR|nr:hypothetical protein T03_9428 [Trichinella britovi]
MPEIAECALRLLNSELQMKQLARNWDTTTTIPYHSKTEKERDREQVSEEKRQAKLDDKRLAKAEQMQPMRPIVGERYWIIVKSSRLAAKQDDKK